MENPNVQQIVDFIQKYATYKDRAALEVRIAKHIDYKTYFVVYDLVGDIVGCCLWNISPDGKTCQVLDCIIKNEYRNNGMMRNMLTRGLAMWPMVKLLQFNRDYTDDGHDRWPDDKIYDINRILRRL